MDILSKIQTELVAGKNQRNSFGKYNYRSCEDILEGLKPLLKKYECSVTLTDDIKIIGDRIYVVATAKLLKDFKNALGNVESQVLGESTAFAREPESQKGMNEAQITGSASSYARKYALNGLFAIDDSKDADTNEHQENINNRPTDNNIDWGSKIRNVLAKIPQAKAEDYKKLLNNKVMPPNKESYDKICKDNNINA